MKAIVVAGGDADEQDAVLLGDADLVIAADGGARWLANRGRRPDRVVGDMDSVDLALLDRLAAEGVIMERHPRVKDASDAELAVQRAIDAGADEVVIIGALGGSRLDHQAANLLLLANPAFTGRRLRIVRGGTSVAVIRGGQRMVLEGAAGDLASLLPIGGDAVGVRAEGLHYGLHGETLQIGSSRGLSNRIVSQSAWITLEHGTLLMIETRKETSQ